MNVAKAITGLVAIGIFLAASGAAQAGPIGEFKIQRGEIDVTGTGVSIAAGVDYDAPASLDNAFIRIVNTRLSGGGKSSGGGNQNSADWNVSIANPGDLLTSIDFARYSNSNNTRVTWEIIEYVGALGGPNEFIVRTQDQIENTAQAATGAAVGSIADDADVVPFITGQRASADDVNNAHLTMHYSSWDDTTDEPTFTRGISSATAAAVSYAVVEFTGSNWDIDRAVYDFGTSTGKDQTVTIDPVDLGKTFIHAQNTATEQGLNDQGVDTRLTAADTVSYSVWADTDQVGVAWIIENTEADPNKDMVVQHIEGSKAKGGGDGAAWTEPISGVWNLAGTSIMGESATSDGTGTAHPRGSINLALTAADEVTLWWSDDGQPNNYSFDVVEWPIAYLLDLTWDGAGPGTWGDPSRWTPGPNTPDANEDAIIDTANTVTVAADQAAHGLAISNSGVVKIAADKRLDVTTQVAAAGGTVELLGGSTLKTAAATIGTLKADGSATVDAAGPVAVAGYSDNGTPTALTLKGGGTFNLASVSTVAGSSFAVNGSSLQGETAAKPLGDAQTLALTGSTLILADVVGAPGSGTVASNPKAHYKFDETGAATTAADETGNYNAPVSTISGTPNWVNDPVRGQVLDFDRVDKTWVDVPPMGDEVDAVSFAMWINPQAVPGSYDALLSNDGWKGGVIHFAINGSYKVEADCNGGGGKKTMTNAMVQDEWHHVVYTYQKNGTVEFYFDGEPDSSFGGIPDRTVLMGGTTEGRSIGQWGDDRRVEAMLDDVVIYTRALTSEEAGLMYASHTPPDFSAVSLTVGAGTSTLQSQCIGDVTFADLTMKQDAALVTAGTAGAAFAGGTTIEAGATAIAFSPQAPMSLGAIDGSAAPNVVIAKTGAGTLVLDSAGTDLAPTATIDVQAGSLQGYHASNPFDEATLKLSGGNVLLSAKAGATSPVTYDNAVVADANGAITAGQGAAGAPAPMDVVLGSAGNGVTINSGNTLTMRATDSYTLSVAGNVTGDNLAVDQGTVNLGAATVANLNVSGTGQVNLSTNINLTNLTVANDSVHAGSHLVTVAESGVMTLGASTYIATSGSFNATGDITQSGAETLILGGTLTVSTEGKATFLEAKIGNGLDGSLVTNHPVYSVMGSGTDIWNKNDNFYFAYQQVAAGEEIDVSARVPGFTGGNDAWRKAEMMIRDDITDTSAFGACMQSFNDNVGAQYRTAVDVNAQADYHGGDPEPTFIRIRRAAGSSTIEYYYKENEADPWLLQFSHDITMTGMDYVGLAVTAHKIDQQTTVDFDHLAGFAFDPVPTTLNNLTGKGTIVGDILIAGELAPGASIGVIDVTGDLTLGADSTFDVEVSGALIDLVTVDGDLGLAGTLSIDGLLTEQAYTILTYTGTLSDAFDDISDVIAQGYDVDYSMPNEVRLTPEPATVALLALGALGLLLRRRR